MTSRQQFPANLYPFSDHLCDFMDAQPDFFNSLKLSNPTRFELIPIIGITRLPDGHTHSNDQIIGMFYCDKVNYRAARPPFFKQDFVVNVDNGNSEFVSYSASNNNGQYVRPLQDFFTIYGNNGQFYHRGGTHPWEHHYNDVNDLPDYPELRNAARSLINNL